MTEDQWRDLVVAEAKSWKDTPYVLGQRAKGAGCDCATLLVETLVAAGKITRQEVTAAQHEAGLDVYSHDWFRNTTTEKYFRVMMRLATQVLSSRCYASLKIKPGNVAMIKAVQSKCWNHGGIVLAWPKVIHAVSPKVAVIDASRDPMWAGAEIVVFDFWSAS